MWGDVIGTSPLDASLDFFDLGGDSLALLNLFAAIEMRFGRRLSVDVLAGGLTSPSWRSCWRKPMHRA